MDQEKPRLARLTAILTQLQSKRLITAREIAEKHQVSIRTIYRDIKTLERSGIPIVTEEGRGYSILEGYKLPPVMFSEEEANALITAEQIINKNKDQSLTEHYQSAVTKVKAVLRNNQKEKAGLLEERIQIRNNRFNEKTSDYLIRLQSAITNFQVIQIDYLSLENYSSQRKVEPFALYSTRENWILVAFCQGKADFRAFRLDRIQKMHFTGAHFSPHEITLQEYLENCRKSWSNTPDIPLTQSGSIIALNLKIHFMQKVKIEPFTVIGLKIRTTNEKGQAMKDIPQFWQKFMTENTLRKIPNKVEDTIYSLYTNYEGDHNKPYDMILGCKVSSSENIPTGMVAHSIQGGTFSQFTSKGNMTEGAIYHTWMEIGQSNIPRIYSTDFEVYGEKARNPQDAEVDIFVAIQE